MGKRNERNFQAWKTTGCVRLKLTPVVLFISLMVPGVFAEGTAYSGAAPGQSSRQWLQEDEEQGGDFLFSAPKAFLGFRIGRLFPNTNSELYDFVMEQLTLDKEDFRAWDLAVDGGFALNRRVDVVFGAEYAKRSKNSEFRDWVDDNELPITQKTYFSQFPMTAGAKILLIPRGRQVGRYAWLPSSFVPYIGGGVGIMWYRFGQSGDFVDYETLEIFSADLESSGWTPTGYLGGGLDIRIAKYTYLTMDVRYSWARTDLERDYVGFDPLELSGVRVSAGLQWHF